KVRELQNSGFGAFKRDATERLSDGMAKTGGPLADLDRMALSRFVNVSKQIGSVGESAQFLNMLMCRVMESAGASAGCFVAVTAHTELEVVASGCTANDGIEVSVASTTLSAHASEQVIRYTLRSGEPLALSNPFDDSRFRNCGYLSELRPCSILCVPLKTGLQATGALYLENGLLRNAFILERMPYVSVLAGQLALVLQNVRTFCDLADRNKRLDAATETVDVPKRVQSHLTKFVPRSVQE